MFPVKFVKYVGDTWRVVTVAEELKAGEPVIAVGPIDMTLPATLAVGASVTVHAKGDNVRVMSGAWVITGVGAGNNLLLAGGDTATLVASSATELELL